MKREKFSVIFKLFVIISILIGILLNVINATSVSAILSYYTLLSNIICMVMFIGVFVSINLHKDYRSSNVYYLLKGGVMIAILVTAITYQVALVPSKFNMDVAYTTNTNRVWANLFVHKISPILVTADYILFDIKGRFKYYYPIIWLFIPLSYVIYVYLYNAMGGSFYGIGGSREFAYKFLDYKQIGYIGVIKSIVIIALLILLLSYIVVFLDRSKEHK